MKPTVFVSSTIRDLSDLRSAIKYFLEELGYRVLLSEFADFDKPIDPNACDACFEAIRNSDVYLLLIGSRRGSWFNESERISVTQQEYRVAYEQERAGRLSLIACVRRHVYDLVKAIPESRPWDSRLGDLEDPVHLAAFLREVERSDEMAAAGTGGPLPRANWVHRFDSFRDIVDILTVALRLRREVAVEVLLQRVAEDLADFGRQLLVSDTPGQAQCPVDVVPRLIDEISLTSDRALASSATKISLSRAHVGIIGLLAVIFTPRIPLSVAALELASTHPGLVEFDVTTRSVVSTPLQRACTRTLAALRTLQAQESERARVCREILAEGSGSKDRERSVISVWPLTLMLGFCLAYARALAEAVNLYQHIVLKRELRDDPTSHLPASPLIDMNERVRHAIPTRDEFTAWVRSIS